MDSTADIARIFKALADENRVTVLHLLAQGEKSAGELLAGVSIGQPTLSHHMKLMCDAGVLLSRQSGRNVYYSINRETLSEAGFALKRLAPETEPTQSEEAAPSLLPTFRGRAGVRLP